MTNEDAAQVVEQRVSRMFIVPGEAGTLASRTDVSDYAYVPRTDVDDARAEGGDAVSDAVAGDSTPAQLPYRTSDESVAANQLHRIEGALDTSQGAVGDSTPADLGAESSDTWQPPLLDEGGLQPTGDFAV